MLPLLFACAGQGVFGHDTSDVPTRPTDTPTSSLPQTDTLPAFYGEVPHNLLMISIDTTRRDHLDRYGTLGLTPFLDGLMDQSFVLDNHVQCSNWTYPGTTCVQLGRSHTDLGFLPSLLQPFQAPMPETPTLASWLGDAGFQSALLTTNSWFSGQWNSNQGFDLTEINGDHLETLLAHGADLVEAAAAGGVDRWYLHVHAIEPHPAYAPPPEYLTALDALDPVPWDLTNFDQHYDAGDAYPTLPPDQQALLLAHLTIRYNGEISYIDDQFERAWTDLAARGMLDDTLVVVWNDHGESFWEHGHQAHAWTLHAQENNAFAFFWAKNIVPGSWNGPTQALDLAPTLFKLWDLPQPPEVTGFALGEAPEGRARFTWSWARNGVDQAVLKDGFKLIFDWQGGLELYDEVSDPDDLVDLYDPDDPVAEDLWLGLKAEVTRMMPLTESVTPVWPVPEP